MWKTSARMIMLPKLLIFDNLLDSLFKSIELYLWEKMVGYLRVFSFQITIDTIHRFDSVPIF